MTGGYLKFIIMIKILRDNSFIIFKLPKKIRYFFYAALKKMAKEIIGEKTIVIYLIGLTRNLFIIFILNFFNFKAIKILFSDNLITLTHICL